MERYDYIVVGAGSAGCILAERLSRGGQFQVLLLEAGGSDSSPWVSVPIGYARLHGDPGCTWQYWTEDDPGLDNRRARWPRGRLVGGSGSINAMVYCRGLPGDFEDWAAAAGPEWGWEKVKSVYDRLETRVSANGETEGDGPICVQDVSDRVHPLCRSWFEAAHELGLPVSKNCNGPLPEGATVYRINTRNGRRCSSAKAYLKPALGRSNLTLFKRSPVRRILFDGRKTVGVELVSGQKFSAQRDVILSAGAIGSPQILQVSGVGPGAVLQKAGLPIVFENANVGGHLQDHLAISYTLRTTRPTLNDALRPLLGQALAALEYAWSRKGPLSLSVNQCGGFLRSEQHLPRADQQLYFNPISYRFREAGGRVRTEIDPFSGVSLCSQPARPTSRGRIEIRSADPLQHPEIRPNSLATEEDRTSAVAGIRLLKRLLDTSAIRAVTQDTPPSGLAALADDDEMLDDFRMRASTVFHPTCTCRMGRDETTSVVDSRLKVHGLSGLRVVDASTFPNITSGNTNAPTMMLALRASDLILNDHARMRQTIPEPAE
jgi:choline dehydrogenase